MSVKLLLILISTIYAAPLPKNTVQIENFDVFQQRSEQNALELYKNILIKNLIVTSDNLKLFLNMEHSENYPKANENQKNSYYPDYDLIGEGTPSLLEGQNWTAEKPMNPSFRNMKSKRQIGGLGGAGGDTQVVLGTFQAMMRPMSTSDIPGLGQNSQNVPKEESASQKTEEDTSNTEN